MKKMILKVMTIAAIAGFGLSVSTVSFADVEAPHANCHLPAGLCG